MTTTALRIGLDFGGVVVVSKPRIPGEDTKLLATDGDEAAQPGMFDAVRTLVATAHGAVWIVSKAGPGMQERTLGWMDAVDFHTRTGLARDHVHFCRERSEKKPICSELGITHFVDDRIHIMQILRGSVPNLYLFGRLGEGHACPPWATPVVDWEQVIARIVGTGHGTGRSAADRRSQPHDPRLAVDPRLLRRPSLAPRIR